MFIEILKMKTKAPSGAEYGTPRNISYIIFT